VRFSVFLVWLALTAAWQQAAGQAEGSAVEIIDRCSESADDETLGLTALEEECPGVTGALEESGYLPLLSTASRDALDVYGLSDLLFVDSWYEAAPPTDREVDVATLGPILDELRAQAAERPLSWFERFKRWLSALLDRPSSAPDNWFTRWLEGTKISDVVATAILYFALALILGLTIFVIVNELRAAGVFRSRSKTPDDAMRGGAAAAAEDAVEDFDTLPVDRKASMLLRMLVATLIKSGRLRTERSLTHRELAVRARFDDARQRESFQRVAALAERTVYASGEVPAEEVEPIVAAARDLDAQLRGAPA
jgi:hypothetical protein